MRRSVRVQRPARSLPACPLTLRMAAQAARLEAENARLRQELNGMQAAQRAVEQQLDLWQARWQASSETARLLQQEPQHQVTPASCAATGARAAALAHKASTSRAVQAGSPSATPDSNNQAGQPEASGPADSTVDTPPPAAQAE